MLALDHQRAQPWGAHHGVTVSCYVLQHPSTVRPHQRGAQLDIVLAFCDSGLTGVERLTTAARGHNTHRARTPMTSSPGGPDDSAARSVPDHPTFGTTIHDVAVDGTFPADGFTERLERWAHSVREAWLPASS
ncbi:hypothetical protein PSA01_17770 [Pseudonocardia saturnea]|uniref:Uncharacterized protein n=1 Tax=Pseudonocardia saturnea TaxID=33909 RepID=A0ABQ0RW78_9PSEU|nr:hypothetical protein Pdca_04120 [Pseudonocardia autotrophica]GEC24748.1 hypothetical protein PSA01_17770 [Pseudonocardia saturnea]